jgi:hypothetical protein
MKHFGMHSGTTQSLLFLFMVEFLVQHTHSTNHRPRDCEQPIVLGSFFIIIYLFK